MDTHRFVMRKDECTYNQVTVHAYDALYYKIWQEKDLQPHIQFVGTSAVEKIQNYNYMGMEFIR